MRTFPDPNYPRHQIVWQHVERHVPAGELAHDRSHIERVYWWSLRLATEAKADVDLAGAMALVHDMAFVPKDSPDRSLGGERSAELAQSVLVTAGYMVADVEAITEAVRTSSWSRGLEPTNALGIVLQDADRLDAIGAIGLMRTFACGQYMSRPEKPGNFYHPDDPCADSDRRLDDRSYAVDHCFAKLLKLAAGMRLPSAKAEAQRRHATIVEFLGHLREEVAILPPTAAE